MQRGKNCALCRRERHVFYCAQCTNDVLQQRRTMLSALQADVAVLRNKSESALNSKASIVEAERRLDTCMKRVVVLAEKVMKTREKLCSERIALVEQTNAFEHDLEPMEHAQKRLQQALTSVENLHQPVLECLDLQIEWEHKNAATVRGNKIRELFQLFQLVPDDSSPSNDPNRPSDGVRTHRRRYPPYFRSIALLPLPISGRYNVMPPEVVAGALGKVIHLLTLLTKALNLEFPHPMVYNSSFSTIGNTSEGAGCHTLYPDGSVGFDRGIAMLHENISALCLSQQVESEKLHPTDLLGNLLCVYESPGLGTLCLKGGNSVSMHASTVATTLPQSSTTLGQSAFLLADSQTLQNSAAILPDYSIVQK